MASFMWSGLLSQLVGQGLNKNPRSGSRIDLCAARCADVMASN